jgi:hypothetical protein
MIFRLIVSQPTMCSAYFLRECIFFATVRECQVMNYSFWTRNTTGQDCYIYERVRGKNYDHLRSVLSK